MQSQVGVKMVKELRLEKAVRTKGAVRREADPNDDVMIKQRRASQLPQTKLAAVLLTLQKPKKYRALFLKNLRIIIGPDELLECLISARATFASYINHNTNHHILEHASIRRVCN